MKLIRNAVLAERRTFLGLSQAQVSRALGRAQNFCFRLEEGSATPDAMTLAALQVVMEVSDPRAIGYMVEPTMAVSRL